MGELKVGDKLWHVQSYGRDSGREVTVKKVGRTWADIGGFGSRLNLETMRVCDRSGVSNSLCWPSQAAYIAEIHRNNLISAFRAAVGIFGQSGEWTADQILAAAEVLGIKLPEPPK